MAAKTFPQTEWQIASASDVGMDSEKLNRAKTWLDSKFADDRYRVRDCAARLLVAEWTHNIPSAEKASHRLCQISRSCRVRWA